MNIASAKHRETDRVSLVVLDALRGLAALYVMLGHATWLLWAGYHEYMASGGWVVGRVLAVSSEVFRFGHQAVLLFFLISGFCIHYRQAKIIRTARDSDESPPPALLDIRSYAWRRFRRLYPPLLVALALTVLFDYVGTRANPAFYRGLTAYPLINANLGNRSYSLTTLLGNLLLQPSFAVPAFGTNGPLWSLAFEFWFYVLYPLLLLLSARCGLRKTLGFVLAVSIVGFLGLGHHPYPWIPLWILQVCTYWIVWAVGAWIAEAYVARVDLPALRWLAIGAVAVLPALAIMTVRDEQYTTASDLCWSAAAGILLAYVMLSPSGTLRRRIAGAAYRLAPLGDISYSLYVVHFPWLALLSAWWLSSHARLPLGIELVVPGVVSALLLALCCWYLVERHFVAAAPRRSPAQAARLALRY